MGEGGNTVTGALKFPVHPKGALEYSWASVCFEQNIRRPQEENQRFSAKLLLTHSPPHHLTTFLDILTLLLSQLGATWGDQR